MTARTSDPIGVLVVEDNPADARLVALMLAAADPAAFRVRHVARLADALPLLRDATGAGATIGDGAGAAGPHVVLLDLSLPDGHGLDLVARVHAAAPRVPIVIMSGSDDEDLAIAGVRAGAQDYLVKGRVEGDLLVRALRYAIERKRAEDHLDYLAHHDTLTGLPNRTLFHDRLQQTLAHARRHDHPFAVFFLDLDGFKLINDTLGHDTGDLFLREIARRLTGCTRESDTVARLGGDEFTIILPDVDGAAEATLVARKILDVLATGVEIDGRELSVTTSIGISLYPSCALDMDGLIKSADIAMYRAKEQGKNTLDVFSPAMDAHTQTRLVMKGDLRHALARDEITLHYQPRARLADDAIVAMKALARWRHPTLGLISPADFIPVAEETGLIVEISTWLLRAACLQQRAWQEAGLRPPRVAVSLSARQFKQRDIVGVVERVLAETGLDPHNLSLELCEDAVTRGSDDALAKLTALKSLGIELAIDEFGTGASSLSLLKKLPLDTLNIDRRFARGLDAGGIMEGQNANPEAADHAAIVTATIAIARTFGLRVVADGIETEGQRAFLASLGCDELQGRLFHAPIPAAVATGLLTRGHTGPDAPQDYSMFDIAV